MSAASLIEAAEEGSPERTPLAVRSRVLGAVQRLRVGGVSTKVLRASMRPVSIVRRDRRKTRGEQGPRRDRR
jgi:nucleotide-binding universal stress UspA family protein